MRTRRHSRLLLVASVVVAAVPVIFGLIRAVATRGDVRYLWLAGAAIAGSMVAMRLGRGSIDPAPVSLRRACGAVAAGALCAAAAAFVIGATAGPGVAIVALAFGLCTGAGAVAATLARQPSASTDPRRPERGRRRRGPFPPSPL
jgi:peptidoglycan/LPS O-acetylase OafA/YrhL